MELYINFEEFSLEGFEVVTFEVLDPNTKSLVLDTNFIDV